MDRRRVVPVVWTLLFAAGIGISSRIPAVRSTVSLRPSAAPAEPASAHPASSPPLQSAQPSSAPRVEQVLSMLQEDRVCDYFRNEPDPAIVLQALILHSGSPLLQQLFGPHGPMSGTPDLSSRDEITLFYNALLYGGLLLGAGNAANPAPAADPGYAERVFQELEARDPSNGAYYYFHAHLLARSGRSTRDQHALLLKAVDTMKFNTFIPLIIGEFRKSGSGNALTWIATAAGLSQVPSPAFPSAKAMSALFARDPLPVQEKVLDFAMMMVEQHRALQIERKSGAELVRAVWKKVHPREPVPDFREKLRIDPGPGQAELNRAMAALRRQPCDRAPLDAYYLKHRDEDLPYR